VISVPMQFLPRRRCRRQFRSVASPMLLALRSSDWAALAVAAAIRDALTLMRT